MTTGWLARFLASYLARTHAVQPKAGYPPTLREFEQHWPTTKVKHRMPKEATETDSALGNGRLMGGPGRR
jgi:hypothetical protein